ncbi:MULTISPECIES: CidA/LrgA family protein [unclassified Carboxylicivirga]|uniref:CidA/LrgA family protein n=1 Tax=Carboxylicivirga TaxID=1628153 RepID=UPI003D33807C
MKIFRQLAIILLINLAGELLSEGLNLPLPGSIVGMLILLILLLTGMVKERHIAETADFFLDKMPFFFIPAGVSVMVAYTFIEGHLAAVVGTIVISTFSVMAVSALVTQLIIKRKRHD